VPAAADAPIRADVSQLVADNAALRTRVDALMDEAERSRDEVFACKKNIAKLADSTRALSAGNDALQSRVGELEGALEQSRVDRAEMAKLGDVIRAHIDEAMKRMAQLGADNAALRAQVDEQKAANAQLRRDVSALQVLDCEGLATHALH